MVTGEQKKRLVGKEKESGKEWGKGGGNIGC